MFDTSNEEDIQTLRENEQFLYDFCERLANVVKDPEKWEAFKEIVGDDICTQLLIIKDQGSDYDLLRDEEE